MKRLVPLLLAIIPCYLLAAEEAPFTFASVKTVPAVSAEEAKSVPEADVKALKDAQSAKSWTNVVKCADALLAIPGTATADRLAWTEARRAAQESLGRWADALVDAKSALSYPAPSNAVHAARMRVIRLLKDRLGLKDDAIRLAREVLDDETLPADWRAEAALLGQAAAGDKRDFTLAMELMQKADSLPTSVRMRTEVRGRVVNLGMYNIKPQPADLIRERCASVATNSFFTFADRVRFAVIWLDWYRGMAEMADRIAPVPSVLSLIEEAGNRISAADAAKLRSTILKNYRAAGEIAEDRAVALGEELLASTNAPAAIRIDAANYLATRLRKAGKALAAKLMLESCFKFPDNGPGDLEAVAQALAGIHVLEDNADAAIEVYRRCLDYNTSPAMQDRVDKLIYELYKKFYRYADALDYFKSRGNRLEVARIYSDNLGELEKGDKLFREILADDSAPRSQRLPAWERLSDDPVLSVRYLPFALGSTTATTNDVIKVLEGKIWQNRDRSVVYRANYREVIRLYGMLERILTAIGRKPSFQVVQYVALSYCGVRNLEAAAELCREAVEKGVASDGADLFELNLLASLLPLKGDRASLVKAIREADARFAGDLPQKTRVSRLDRVGSAAVVGANEPLARALDEFRASLFVPYAKREYKVRYSQKPITGPEGWDELSPVPERQKMDRQYGGSVEFLLETDVGTGNRGEGIGTEKAKEDAPVPTIQIACDAAGIHFRFEAPDEKAREVAAGLVGAGSFEGYVAAGANQPYYCLLMDVAPKARVSIWNTTYSTRGHRRIPSDNQSLCKSETAFTDHSTISYIMLSWNAFSTLIPENGTVWDFENIHWGRADKAAWNGAESAHGRMQWGRLVFDLPPKARIEILKGVIFDARKIYLGATGAYGMGPVDRWRDPVLGDKEFYDECLAPLVAKLDSYLPLVKPDMSDEDVVKIAEEALPLWRDIRQEVELRRERYLLRKMGR
jgi:tetratricopeptide (TPR) repeat protein